MTTHMSRQARHVRMPEVCLLLLTMLACFPGSLRAQTIDDGIMLPKHELFAGNLYSHDSWDQYWEGALERTNGNIGTLTTQTDIWSANYGVTNRLNVIAAVPYVWTRASQGVLQGQSGFQDITLAGKYSLFNRPATKYGLLRGIGVVSGGLPLTNYTPDFQPLSIGMASKRVSGRFTLNFQSHAGWFLNGSAAYTWRSNVTLDRPYYFTEDKLFLTSEVDMPNVVDGIAAAGYARNGLMAEAFYSQQRTQGGGDIRRQDMPFVSNRINVARVGGMLMYPIPKLRRLVFELSYAYTVDGRNVGQATTITTGFLYRYSAHRRPTP
jgi:hypothetical protein